MGHSISRVDDKSGEVVRVERVALAVWSTDLTVQCKGSLHSDEQAFDSECLEHDFRHLLSVLRRVHGWFCEDEPVFLGLAPEVGVDRLVPELLDAFPVFDLASSEEVADLMCLLVCHGFIADVVVHLH